MKTELSVFAVGKGINRVIETTIDRESIGFFDTLDDVVQYYDLQGKDKDNVLSLVAGDYKKDKCMVVI